MEDRMKYAEILEIELNQKMDLENGIFHKQNSQFLLTAVKKAFQNKNQKKSDKTQLTTFPKIYSIITFGLFQSYILKAFKSEYQLLDTIPIQLFKAFDQFVDIHGFFPTELLVLDDNKTDYTFDVNDAVFRGPYGNRAHYVVEHLEKDKPHFFIQWSAELNSDLIVAFCDPTCKTIVSAIIMNEKEIYLQDFAASKRVHQYQITSDGNLGQKITI